MKITTRAAVSHLAILLLLAAAPVLAAEPCPRGSDVALWTSPREPRPGRPLRIVAVSESGPPGELVVWAGDGTPIEAAVVRQGGPPWSLVATVASTSPGVDRVEVRRGDGVAACREMSPSGPGPTREPGRGSEPAPGWDRASEALYAAWIEHLFAAPPDETLAFPALDVVLRNPSRNFLHGHLGLGEDDAGGPRVQLTPDCADLPYVLRAYFAWKLGLPVGFRSCSRGTAATPPRCGPPTVLVPAPDLRSFAGLMQRLMDAVHSGNARTALDDDATDFYPLPLARDVLRPGTVYADPYGHTLVVVQWVPQTAERSGLLLAVDAQPDNSVGRKRFWEGTFLFARTPSAGPGFKAARPLVRGADGAVRPLANAALTGHGAFAAFDDEQAAMSPDAFYGRMAALIDPDGLAPERAYEATLDALVEQLEARVRSVDSGEEWMRAHPGTVVRMPAGAAIFETTGPWEDYATPARDLRLLIAMRVLSELPARIERHPELFVLGGRSSAEARAAVERLHGVRTAERSISYERSDGGPWRLTVAEVLARRERLETAYHPNDCVEVRWGAAEGSAEHATCRRRAPADERARMETYRPWFREGRRPPR